MRRLLRFVISAASGAILIAVVLGYFGFMIFELDVLAHFRLHFLMMCAPIGAIATFLHCWGALWRVIAAAVLALCGLGVLWEDFHREGIGDRVEVTVMAANLYQNNPEPEQMKRVLLEVDADVLVTMETTKAALSGPYSLALNYPYRLSLRTTGQILRTVIWSKFPMRDGRLMLEDRIEPTGASAIIEHPSGAQFAVLGVHFGHNIIGNQQDQIEALGRIAERLPRPLVITGDFNATAWSYALRRAEDLTSTRRAGGFRLTWKGAYPTFLGDFDAPFGLQIDHLLASEELGIRAILTTDIPGSDHRGLITTLLVPSG